MKVFLRLLLLLVVANGVFAAPQGIGNEQVELVPVVNTNQGHPEDTLGGGGVGGFPIIFLRNGFNRDRSPFGGFPILRFGGSFDVPDKRLNTGDDGKDVPDFPNFPFEGTGIPTEVFTPFFDRDSIPDEAEGSKRCGIICTLFKGLTTEIKKIEDDIKEIRRKQEDKQNDIDAVEEIPNDDLGPIRNSTYEEKVLRDGTVVKINRTLVHDTFDNGQSFFAVHSTSFHTAPSDETDKTIKDLEAEKEDNKPSITNDKGGQESNEELDVSAGVEPRIKVLSGSRRKREAQFTQQSQGVSDFWDAADHGQQQNTVVDFDGERHAPTIVSLHDDTRVNDILLENSRRGNYIQLETDAEIINDGYYLASVQPQPASTIPEFRQYNEQIDVAIAPQQIGSQETEIN